MNIPWMYQLFLSVDLENSTKFKKELLQVSNKYPEWANFFKSFYIEFTELFSQQLSNAKKVPEPSIWKCLGDEIIYHVKIEDSSDVAVYVDCFKKAVSKYNATAATVEQPKDCKCHGTVWGAGFPVRNREVLIPQNMKMTKKISDFIGFDMDLGFRIAKFSRPDRVVVSLPVAYILSENGYDSLRFYDHVDIKGINQKYPLFWTCPDSDVAQKTKWHPKCESSDVVGFCKSVFEDDKISTFSTPFIEGDKSGKCTKISKQMKAFKAKIEKAEDTSQKENEQKSYLPSKETKTKIKQLPKQYEKLLADKL